MAAFLQLLLLGALWGMSFLFMRLSVSAFGPVLLIQGRLFIAALFVLLAVVLLRKIPDWKIFYRHHLLNFLVIGLLNLALPFLMFGVGAQTLSASILSIINATAPFFSALFAWMLLRTPMSKSQWIGLAIGFLGVLTVMAQGMVVKAEGWWWAAIITLMAPVCYGLCTTFIRYRQIKLSPIHLTLGTLWTGTILMLPLSLTFPAHAEIAAIHWWSMLGLGILCTGLAYIIFYHLFETIGATRTLTVTFLVPLFATLWGVLLLHEAITLPLILGGGLILLGVAVNNQVFRWKVG